MNMNMVIIDDDVDDVDDDDVDDDVDYNRLNMNSNLKYFWFPVWKVIQ